MYGYGIVNAGSYSLCLQKLAETIPFLYLYYVDIIDMRCPGLYDWNSLDNALKLFSVQLGVFPAGGIPPVKVAKLDLQDGRLEFVQARMDSQDFVVGASM